MARYLSVEWFAEVAAAAPPAAGDPGHPPGNGSATGSANGNAEAPDAAPLTLEQRVEGTPDGQVVYRVVVAGSRARIEWPVDPGSPGADLRITCDWPTAVAVARGELSTQRALMQGRLRVAGGPGRLGDAAGRLAGADPVPPVVRASTTF